MKKSILLLTVVLLFLAENVVIWYASNFYYQYRTHEKIADSKIGQTEVCKSIPLSESLHSVLKMMRKYSANARVDSTGIITLYYGSEAKGFVTAAGVGFDFDENYRLISKSCEEFSEPKLPT